ncbi:hypothetical protein JOD97_003844 [Duganella sp. 1411]|uniref:TniQ family protein n=1 Tax=Duganella sp. 1411 TaxID=2806572 RepID=UPI001AEB57FC|nr:TniQ family protein [Duganella sp. 1411]MBP1205782.1 hypothetical protein [Duganella sp. 1411]
MNITHRQPDELLAGVVGRLCVINGCTGEANLLQGLRLVHGLPDSTPTLHVLAEHFWSTPHQIAFGHTLLPLQRAISAHAGTKREESVVSSHVASSNISFRPKVEARSCIRCVKDAIDTDKPSYWRRVHNMHTVDWCLEHQIPLIRFPLSTFELLPADAVELHEGNLCMAPLEIAPNSVLGRYAELLRRWLNRNTAYSSIALNKVIQEGCRQRGLRFSQAGKRRLLSDLAKDVLPQDWVERFWPEIANKTQGTYIGRLDGSCKDKHVAYPGPTCALALSILFGSADEIEVRLQSAHQEEMKPSSRDPDLPLQLARRAFIDGSTLETVCLAYGIPSEKFEFWLRSVAKYWQLESGSKEEQ